MYVYVYLYNIYVIYKLKFFSFWRKLVTWFSKKIKDKEYWELISLIKLFSFFKNIF